MLSSQSSLHIRGESSKKANRASRGQSLSMLKEQLRVCLAGDSRREHPKDCTPGLCGLTFSPFSFPTICRKALVCNPWVNPHLGTTCHRLLARTRTVPPTLRVQREREPFPRESTIAHEEVPLIRILQTSWTQPAETGASCPGCQVTDTCYLHPFPLS